MKKSLLLFFLWVSCAWAQIDCWYCGQQYQYQQMPIMITPFYQRLAYSPWYQWYGQQRFHNYYYPSAWYGPGFRGPTYPGSGEVIAAKPNVYLSAPKNVTLRVKLNPKSGANLLITTPIHGKEGWATEYREGQVEVGKVHYDYLYYDYRLQDDFLQSKLGFCGGKEAVIEQMIKILDKRSFKKNEIEDFLQHAYSKIPEHEALCIFPQTDQELQSQLTLELSDKNFVQERIIFVIVLKDRPQLSKLKRFEEVPVEKFEPPSRASSAYEIREWGLAFLQGS